MKKSSSGSKKQSGEIPDDDRLHVIKFAPLISIDLIIRNYEGKILLGLRSNNPAKGTWFVPGGSIRKNKSIDEEFERISEKELNVKFSRSQANFVGIFENKYDSNYKETPGIGTDYIVMVYEICSNLPLDKLPKSEHLDWGWFSQKEAKDNKSVHSYILPYFTSTSFDKLMESQYSALNARRDSLNSLVWQTPVLSLTAQAFLFTIALSKDVSTTAQKIAAGLAFFVAVSSFQLLIKHRTNEQDHAKLLEKVETEHGFIRINEKLVHKITWNPLTWLAWFPSYYIWLFLLLLFGLSALRIFINPCFVR